MNHDRIQGMWRQVNGRLREQWGLLTSDRQCMVAGRQDQFAGRTQARRGIKQEQAQRQLQDFLRRNSGWNFSNRH